MTENYVKVSKDGLVVVPDETISDRHISPNAEIDVEKIDGLADVATSGDYNDLDNLPTLGTAAATDATAFATATQGAKADTAVQQDVIGNLLPPNVATGTDELGDTTGFAPGGCAISSSTEAPWRGNRALRVTSAGGVLVLYAGSTSSITGTIPVTPGQTYEFSFYARSDLSTKAIMARTNWIKAGGGASSIQAAVVGSPSFLTPDYQRFVVSGVAPDDAATAGVQLVRAQDFAAGEVFDTDGWMFAAGAGGLYSDPGVPVPNTGTYTDESVGRRIFTWDAVNARWQMTYGDTGWRDITDTLINGWAAALVLVRRTTNRSHLFVQGLDASNATSSAFLPVNEFIYRDPPGRDNATFLVSGGSVVVIGLQGNTSAHTIATYASLTNTVNGSCDWFTTQAWPSSLIGTAGDIPT